MSGFLPPLFLTCTTRPSRASCSTLPANFPFHVLIGSPILLPLDLLFFPRRDISLIKQSNTHTQTPLSLYFEIQNHVILFQKEFLMVIVNIKIYEHRRSPLSWASSNHANRPKAPGLPGGCRVTAHDFFFDFFFEKMTRFQVKYISEITTKRTRNFVQ